MKEIKEIKCKHYWFYEHTVYGSSRNNKVSVHRQCSYCKQHQIAHASDWKKPRKSSYELPDLTK